MRVNRAFGSGTVDMPPRSPYLPPMHWVAQSAKDTASETLEERFWDAADQFRANDGLKPQEYSGPIPAWDLKIQSVTRAIIPLLRK